MAQTTIASPQLWTPGYNPVKYIMDSTNKNKVGFKYVFDIYPSGSATKLKEFKILPRFGDGYGECDLSRLLVSQMSYTEEYGTTGGQNATDSFYKYDVKVGEEFQVSYSINTPVDNGGYLRLNTTTSNTFSAGDQVSISGSNVVDVDGLYNIVSVQSATSFTISLPYKAAYASLTTGTIVYADGRKTITRNITTMLNRYVFNGALPFKDFPSYNYVDYQPSSNNFKLLTSMPTDGMYVREDQHLSALMINSTGGYQQGLYLENSNGDIFRMDIPNTNTVTYMPLGAANLDLYVESGTPPLIKSNTEWYEIYPTNYQVGDEKYGQSFRFYIDRRCSINDYYIGFIDRLGAFNTFAFTLKSYERGTIQRQTYNKNIYGYVSSGDWLYSTTDVGEQITGVQVSKTYELSTNWITESMAIYFEELLTSPRTFFIENDILTPCIIQDSSFEVEKQRNKNLFRKTITIRLANENIVNV